MAYSIGNIKNPTFNTRIRKEQRTMILILSVSALLITSITTAWAIYSNKQMEEMQEEMWDMQEELENIKGK